MRNNTSAPEILKSAAHAQKHSEARQASEDYDQQADDRLVKAAYDFNLKFIAPLRRYDWPPRSVSARAGQMGAAGSAHSAFVPNLSMAVTLLGFGAPASFGRYEVGTWESRKVGGSS